MKATGRMREIERVQIGARMEKTLVKTLKALADIWIFPWAICWKAWLCMRSKENRLLGEDPWTREAVERDLRSRINRAR